MNAEKKDFLIIIAGLGLLALIIILAVIGGSWEKEVSVITDQNLYEIGAALKVKIENDSGEKICFSSCYPYYFEKKDEEWIGYDYEACPHDNLVEKCIGPEDIKAFELNIPPPPLKKGVHRLVIPACIGCSFNETFKESQRFYSNEFIVK